MENRRREVRAVALEFDRRSPKASHIGETDCVAGHIGFELRCAERKFISLTSRPNSVLRETAQTVAVSRENNLLC
jgi:hypothetical protein